MLPVLGSLASLALLSSQPQELALTEHQEAGGDLSLSPDWDALQSIDDSRVVGGRPVKSCQWPSAMIIDTGRFTCSGTLVHPQLFVTAAHCLLGNSFTVYSGDGNKGEKKKTLKERKVEYCRKHPEFRSTQATPLLDVAYCKLQEPVKDVAPMPIMMGCEVDYLKNNKELDVTVVGFGFIRPNDRKDIGIKYEVDTKFLGIQGGLARVGVTGKGPLKGDSGGPVYIRLPEDKFNKDAGWRIFGITSTSRGNGAPDGKALYGMIHTFVEYLEKDSGLDITPCTDADGTWNPNKDCKGAFNDPYEASGDWVNGCKASPPGGYISSCGKPFKPEPDEDDSTPPKVKIRGVKGGQKLPADTTELEIEVEAEDESGIESVTLKLNHEAQKAVKKPPYAWTLKDLSVQKYELTAEATDKNGNAASHTVIFRISKEGDDSSGTQDSQAPDSGKKGSDDEDPSAKPGESKEGSDKAGSKAPGQDPEGSPEISQEPPEEEKGGCRLQNPASQLWALTLLPLLTLLLRRRS